MDEQTAPLVISICRQLDGLPLAIELAAAGEPDGTSQVLRFAIDGLASLATDLGDWHRAAMLHGASQALLDRTGVQREALDNQNRQESLGQARAAIGDEQVQRAYNHGMALGLDQVIDLALGGIPPGT